MRRLLKRFGLFLVLFVSIRYTVTTPGVLHTLWTGFSLLAQKAEVSVPHAALPASTSGANSRISAKPTLTAKQIDALLTAYHSPAASLSPYSCDTGSTYHTAPAPGPTS